MRLVMGTTAVKMKSNPMKGVVVLGLVVSVLAGCAVSTDRAECPKQAVSAPLICADTAITFANPIDLEYRMRPEQGKDFREGADPDVAFWNGRYWLFASKCGGYYVSDDLASWKLVRTDELPLEEYAPTVWVMNGGLYFSSRGGTRLNLGKAI